MIAEPFLQPPYVPLRPGRSNGSKGDSPLSEFGDTGPEVEIAVVSAENTEERTDAEDGRRAEAGAVAEWIAGMWIRPPKVKDCAITTSHCYFAAPIVWSLSRCA